METVPAMPATLCAWNAYPSSSALSRRAAGTGLHWKASVDIKGSGGVGEEARLHFCSATSVACQTLQARNACASFVACVATAYDTLSLVQLALTLASVRIKRTSREGRQPRWACCASRQAFLCRIEADRALHASRGFCLVRKEPLAALLTPICSKHIVVAPRCTWMACCHARYVGERTNIAWLALKHPCCCIFARLTCDAPKLHGEDGSRRTLGNAVRRDPGSTQGTSASATRHQPAVIGAPHQICEPQDTRAGALCQIGKLVARSTSDLPDELHAIAVAVGRRDGRRLNAVELSDSAGQAHVIFSQRHFVQGRPRGGGAKLCKRMVLLNQVCVQ
mmetsp:Transcript_135440/g.320999  ORF Transcript_135440/g.320999 Transcript_135440/m.320999 type:complete len:335 (-) Transcript_135440:289-1293(-)